MPEMTRTFTGKMKYPPFLKEGSVIGCVAPSFGCNIEPYRSALLHACDRFTSMGYGLDLGFNCFAGNGIGISNTPKNCGEELITYYLSDKNDLLLSCGGGELMCEVLDYIDFARLAGAKPKWYVGYSDNTNFTFLLTTILETPSIYAPCAPAFGMEPWHESIEDLWALLNGKKLQFEGYSLWEKESLKTPEQPLTPYHVTEPRILRIFSNGWEEEKSGLKNIFMEGRLLGGCMDCLVNLLGTNYDNVSNYIEAYKEDGFLWFLESCDLSVFGIRRAIWQMEHAGWFKHVKGFLIGRPYCFGENLMGLDAYHAVTDLLEKYHVPIIMDMDFGHLPPAMPMICGAYATVRAGDNKIKMEYQLK